MTFQFERCLASGLYGYIDWHFSDGSQNGALRNWELHYDCERKYFYATLQRSPTPEDDFGEPVTAPSRLKELFISMLPADELERINQ